MKGTNPMITVELIPDPEQGGFTARIPDIPASGEGESEDEAIADLKDAIRGYIETFGLDDAPITSARSTHPTSVYHAYQDWILSGWLATGKAWERPRFRIAFLTQSVNTIIEAWLRKPVKGR